MGIRPFVAITQELGNTAANIASSTMKGIIVGPCIQSEHEFRPELNISAAYGSLSTILSDIATAKKTIQPQGLFTGSNIVTSSLSFGVKNAKVTLDMDGDYSATTFDATTKYILKVDLTTSGVTTIAKILNSGAEAGDTISVGKDVSGTIVYQEHKVRKFEITDTSDLLIHLWDDVDVADETVVLSLIESKIIEMAKVDILSPMVASINSTGITLDNTETPADGALATSLYVYSPIGSSDGITFENRHITTMKMTTLSNYTMVQVGLKVTDGELYNFFDANRSDLSNNIFEVSEYNYVSKLGPAVEANKLSYAMSLVCKEVPGATMRVYVTEDDTPQSYRKGLSVIATSDIVYTVSVLTDEDSVIEEVVKMAKLSASESVAKWKMGIIAPRTPHFSQTISVSDYTVEAIASTENFTITSTNGGFLATGLSVDDYLFSGETLNVAKENYYSGYGETYSSAAIGKVVAILTDKRIIVEPILASGTLIDKLSGESAIFGGLNSFNELSSKIKKSASDISQKGVVSIFPDKFEIVRDDKEILLPSFFLAAIVNGVLAHLPPQQGISNLSIPSINRVIGSSFTFTDNELDEIAASGVMVFLQADNSSDPYVLRQLTTDMKGLESMEINKVRCLDFATLSFAEALKGYIGIRNVSQENAIDLRDELERSGNLMVESTKVLYLGSVITTFDIIEVSIPDIEQDAINAIVEVTTPTSLNKIRLAVSSGINV